MFQQQNVHFPQVINFAENSLQLLLLGARCEKLPLLKLNDENLSHLETISRGEDV